DSLPSARTILTVPGRIRDIKGVCPGSIPSSPASPGKATKVASPVNRESSALTTSTCNVLITHPCLITFWLSQRLRLWYQPCRKLVQAMHHIRHQQSS